MLLTFPPGSNTDGVARLYARRLQALTGQPFIVDNRPGGNGFIAAQAVASAVPDGHTLFFATNSPVAVNPSMFRSLPYDPLRDFVPVARIFYGASILVVPAASPYRTLGDLIAAAKARPRELNYAAGSTAYQVATEEFARRIGASLQAVPYKGAVPAVLDTMAGVVQFTVADISIVLHLIKDGRLRALANTSTQRHPLLPDVPTVKEAGIDGYEFTNWAALFAPARTPRAVVDRLAVLTRQITEEPATLAEFSKSGAQAFWAGPDETRAFHVAETAAWKMYVKRAGIQPE